MPTRPPRRAVALAVALLALAAPAAAAAEDAATAESVNDALTGLTADTNAFFVIFAASLVLFMQAGFACLEIGMSRQKNVGAVAGKIAVNLALSFLVFWAVGYALGFGNGGDWVGVFGDRGTDASGAPFASGLGALFVGADAASTAKSQLTLAADLPNSVFFYFQVVFAAVSLAIVWGTTLDRTKFVVYAIFAVTFVGVIYPTATHWSWGGGWLAERGFLDFAGSTNVHLQGAMAALAATLLLGPRLGKYGRDGRARAIPGHSMPLAVVGVLILWLGWMGFNGGSYLAVSGGGGELVGNVLMNTNLAAAAGIAGAMIGSAVFFRYLDVGVIGNGAIGGLVAITAGCFFVDSWAAALIGLVAGFLLVPVIQMLDRVRVDDPVGAIAAHGVSGIWGTLAVGLFLVQGRSAVHPDAAGLVYGGGAGQLLTQGIGVVAVGAFTFAASFGVFAAIKATIGLRVSDLEETNGLDISEHGQFGYPEAFIDVPGAVPEEFTPPSVRTRHGSRPGAYAPAPAAQPAGGTP